MNKKRTTGVCISSISEQKFPRILYTHQIPRRQSVIPQKKLDEPTKQKINYKKRKDFDPYMMFQYHSKFNLSRYRILSTSWNRLLFFSPWLAHDGFVFSTRRPTPGLDYLERFFSLTSKPINLQRLRSDSGLRRSARRAIIYNSFILPFITPLMMARMKRAHYKLRIISNEKPRSDTYDPQELSKLYRSAKSHTKPGQIGYRSINVHPDKDILSLRRLLKAHAQWLKRNGLFVNRIEYHAHGNCIDNIPVILIHEENGQKTFIGIDGWQTFREKILKPSRILYRLLNQIIIIFAACYIGCKIEFSSAAADVHQPFHRKRLKDYHPTIITYRGLVKIDPKGFDKKPFRTISKREILTLPSKKERPYLYRYLRFKPILNDNGTAKIRRVYVQWLEKGAKKKRTLFTLFKYSDWK